MEGWEEEWSWRKGDSSAGDKWTGRWEVIQAKVRKGGATKSQCR